MIVDRHGEPLAVSTPVTTLWVNPQQIDSSELSLVAPLLELNGAELKRRVDRAQRQGRSFYYVKRQVEPEIATQVLNKKIDWLVRRYGISTLLPSGRGYFPYIGPGKY